MQKRFIQTFLTNKPIAYIVAACFLLITMLFAISIGTVHVPITDILSILSAKIFRLSTEQMDPMYTNIVWSIRLPRVLLAGLWGRLLQLQEPPFKGC